MARYDVKIFEEDPLLSIFNPKILSSGKDIVRGGAKYANLGMTSVGLSTVVNSLLNIEQLVFVQKAFTLNELNNLKNDNIQINKTPNESPSKKKNQKIKSKSPKKTTKNKIKNITLN